VDRDETQVGGDLVAVLDRNQVALFIIKYLNSSREKKRLTTTRVERPTCLTWPSRVTVATVGSIFWIDDMMRALLQSWYAVKTAWITMTMMRRMARAKLASGGLGKPRGSAQD